MTSKSNKTQTSHENKTARRSLLFWLLPVGYLILWLVTSTLGTRDVRAEVTRNLAPNQIHAAPPSAAAGTTATAGLSVRARAYGPFVVVANYSWSAGHLYGGGGKTVYLWAAGLTARLYDIDKWSE